MKTLKKPSIYFCVIFTITTLVSSILQLYMGQVTDNNAHIIDRGVVVLIAIITITLFSELKLKNKMVSFLTSYIISMLIVFIYVWITGFWQELHPNAYRDIFLNFTIVSFVVAIAITTKDYVKNKRQYNEKDL